MYLPFRVSQLSWLHLHPALTPTTPHRGFVRLTCPLCNVSRMRQIDSIQRVEVHVRRTYLGLTNPSPMCCDYCDIVIRLWNPRDVGKRTLATIGATLSSNIRPFQRRLKSKVGTRLGTHIVSRDWRYSIESGTLPRWTCRCPSIELQTIWIGRIRMFSSQLHNQNTSWEDIQSVLNVMESARWESAYFYDHFVPPWHNTLEVRETDSLPTFEGLTLMACAAAVTSRSKLGVLVCGNTYRNPALMAKTIGHHG